MDRPILKVRPPVTIASEGAKSPEEKYKAPFYRKGEM